MLLVLPDELLRIVLLASDAKELFTLCAVTRDVRKGALRTLGDFRTLARHVGGTLLAAPGLRVERTLNLPSSLHRFEGVVCGSKVSVTCIDKIPLASWSGRHGFHLVVRDPRLRDVTHVRTDARVRTETPIMLGQSMLNPLCDIELSSQFANDSLRVLAVFSLQLRVPWTSQPVRVYKGVTICLKRIRVCCAHAP